MSRRQQRPWLFVLAMVLALGGCATIRRNEARFDGNLLVRAGFEVQPANSPDREDQLRTLPPLKLVPDRTEGHPVYRLADPYQCRCVYVGNATAFREYQGLVSEDYLNTLLSLPHE